MLNKAKKRSKVENSAPAIPSLAVKLQQLQQDLIRAIQQFNVTHCRLHDLLYEFERTNAPTYVQLALKTLWVSFEDTRKQFDDCDLQAMSLARENSGTKKAGDTLRTDPAKEHNQ